MAEDVAIGFGYNNVTKRVPRTPTSGTQQPVCRLTELLRMEMAAAGYTEALTLGLCSKADVSTRLRLPEDKNAVVLKNPKTPGFQICRTHLLPGLLKTLHENKDVPCVA